MPTPYNDGIQKVYSGYGLPVDAQGTPIQAAAKAQTQSSGGTHVSPKTVSSTEIDMTVPAAAVAFVVAAKGADLRVAFANAGTATEYFIVADGKTERFPCADHATIHLLRNASTDVTASFFFELLGT